MKNPLNDKNFLKQLDLVKRKKTYVRIYNLTYDEQIRETIEGKAVSGNIDIDGASAVRRTCSLSIVTKDVNINNYLWSLNTKIKIEIGIENIINSKYDNIIWFNQGIFVLTSFNISYSSNNYSINLTGQDKMCLLNGAIGGQLPASIDFKQQVINTNVYEKVNLGPIFIPGRYQIPKESYMALDQNDVFTENRIYFKKEHYDFKPLDNISEKDFNAYGYYKDNTELFVDAKHYFGVSYLTTDALQRCLDDKIILYTKEKIKDEENEYETYEPLDLSNQNYLKEFDNSKTYYVSQAYKHVDIRDKFDKFERYYLKDENGKISETLLDEIMFEEMNFQDIFIQNYYVPVLENDQFETGISYYEKIGGSYKRVYLNNYTYQKNFYYYEEITSFEIAEDNFDKNKNYYDLDNNFIDFYQTAYTNYKSNEFYIPNIYNDDFVLYNGEYDPQLQYYEKKVYTKKEDIPIKTIIKEAVHTYGKEPYHNIIINDIDDDGLLLKEYIGNTPLYLLIHNGICENITDENQECYLIDGTIEEEIINLYSSLIEEELDLLKKQYDQELIDLEEYDKGKEKIFSLLIQNLNAYKTIISDQDNIIYNSFIEDFDKNPSKIFFITEETSKIKLYTILRLEQGDAAGYELTDLTYPYELTSSPGEALTSILDKIKDTLQNYEYFYDVDGHFIFQKKKTYLNTSWNNIITSNNETFATSAADTSAVQYTFEDNDLIISIGNNIKIDNLKNDYSVWGNRKTINDVVVPIHARFAVDQKPFVYTTFPKSRKNYVVENSEEILEIKNIDGLKYLCQDIYINKEYIKDITGVDKTEIKNFNKIYINPTPYKKETFAGYYYNYIVCDWREIIYQMALDYYKHNQENDFLAKLAEYNIFEISEEKNDFMNLIRKNGGKLYPTGITGYEQYYEDMEGFWRELYNPNPEIDLGHSGGYYLNGEWQELIDDFSKFNCDYYLPEEDFAKYIALLDASIEALSKEIEKINDELKKYKNDANLNILLEELSNVQQKLEDRQYEKTLLLKSYYTKVQFQKNDSNYKKLQEEYSQIESEKDELILSTKEEIISILENSFKLE